MIDISGAAQLALSDLEETAHKIALRLLNQPASKKLNQPHEGPHMADLSSVNAFEIETFERISQSNADDPVFMLNLNKCRVEANYPSGQLYNDYLAVLDALLLLVGGKILWRTSVLGHVVCNRILMKLRVSGIQFIRRF